MIRSAAIATLALSCAASLAQEEIDFGDVTYEKLATRELTEQAMITKLTRQVEIDWGPWYILSPFPGNDSDGSLLRPLPPEDDLAKMGAGGDGPDLEAVYAGKRGVEAAWQEIGLFDNRRIDLRIHEDNRLNERGIAYLYREARADRAGPLEVTMGSDDGLRFWFNGRLLAEADVPRGLNPEDHRVTLPFEEGVNHIFVKVSQGAVGWDYQLNWQQSLDPALDARLQAQLNRDFPTEEMRYYPAETVPVPGDVVLEVGGIALMGDGRLAVCTRRGDVWLVEYTGDRSIFDAAYTRFARGLHEPLGLAVRVEDGREVLYAVQRAELTRLEDTDGDGAADLYETFCDDWGVSGNYHEFSFGPKFDAAGDAWVSLNVGFCGSLGKSIAPWRGWVGRVNARGEFIPVCDGVRSPNGIGIMPTGEVFYVDNQGDYVGTNRMSLVAPKLWHGHPSTLHWRERLEGFEMEPPRQKATVWFPYRKMGQSVADITVDTTGGGFGPFAGQVFVGDQTLATVMRVALEQVDGHWQGACFPFREGLDCGVNRIEFDAEGSMIVGQTDRGWGSVGRRRYGVQRIRWSGETPFEIATMRLLSHGFELGFTRDVDPATAGDPDAYSMSSYTYEYHQTYGSDEMETETLRVVGVEVVDPRTVRIEVEGIRSGGEGFVHELHADGVRAESGEPLLHREAYYTVQRMPPEEG